MAAAQNGCGDTLNWTSPSCQVIGAGSLNSQWTVISRHGEYGQSETECNIPSAVSVSGGILSVTTSRPGTAPVCGDWNADGSPRDTPSPFSYASGDIQASTFSFKYGTVIARMKLPPQNAGTWPSLWFLTAGSNGTSGCIAANKYSGDPNGPCPQYGTSGYQEIDMIECKPNAPNNSGWCNLVVHNPDYSVTGGPCVINQNPVDTNWHTWVLNWTSSGVVLTIDPIAGNAGAAACSVTARPPDTYMFPIFQTQTASTAYEGPPVDANLPVQFQMDYIKICSTNLTAAQCSAAASNDPNVIFYDDFNGIGTVPAPPTGLKAIVN